MLKMLRIHYVDSPVLNKTFIVPSKTHGTLLKKEEGVLFWMSLNTEMKIVSCHAPGMA